MLRYDELLDPSENVTVVRMFSPAARRQEEDEFQHAHEFIEVVYCYEGSGIQYIGGREYPMSRGTLVFLNYGQSHGYRATTDLHYYNILLTPSFLSESLIHTVDAFALLALTAFSDFQNAISNPPPVFKFTGRDMLEVEDLAERMEREFTRKEAGYRTILYGYMTVLFTKIFRKMALPVVAADAPGAPAGRGIAPEILDYIEQHCCEKITLAELARKSFYNPSYFSRIFKEFSGQSLTEYVHKKRIERAVELLRTTDEPVEQIGVLVGYNDKKQFYRQFRQYTGETPGAVRKDKRQTAEPEA